MNECCYLKQYLPRRILNALVYTSKCIEAAHAIDPGSPACQPAALTTGPNPAAQ
jgi:hypothetical protein